VTNDNPAVDNFGSTAGCGNLTVAERHYKAIMAGTTSLRNNDKEPVLEAIIWSQGTCEEFMRKRMEESAVSC